MNTLVVFAAVLAVVVAGPLGTEVSVSRGALGSYDIKYATDAMSRSEHRNILGEVNGGYSYVDPYGHLRKVEYIADERGFQAIGSGIPLPVHDTPEVALAKAEHIALLRNTELTSPIAKVIETPVVTPLEISNIPLVRSSYIDSVRYVNSPLVRIAETPEIVELGHVARREHLFI